MDNQDSQYSFPRASSREPSSQSRTAGNWPAQFLPSRSQAANLRGQSESQLQSSSTYQTNTNTFQSNADTAIIWAQPAARWNPNEHSNSLRRAGTSPAPGRTNGSAAAGQQGPSYMGGRARNSITSLGLPPPSRPEFSQNDSSDANLMRQFDSMAFNKDPFETLSASASVASPMASAAVPAGSAGLSNGTTAAPAFPHGFSYASAAPAFSSQQHRANLQSSTAFSSPGAGAYAVPHHRNSLPDSSAPASVIMPLQGMESSQEPVPSYRFDLSGHPQAAGPSASASFQFNPGSTTWNNAASQANGTAGYLQNRNYAANPQQPAQNPVDQYSYAQNGVPYQQQSQRGYNAGNTAALLNRGQPMQAGLANQLPSLLRDSDSQSIALRAAFAQNRQAAAGSFDTLSAANFMGTGRPAATPQSLHEQFLQSQNMFLPGNLPLHSAGLPFGGAMIQNNASGALRDRDPSRAMRSTLLKDFLESKGSRNFELSDITGHIVEFSGDQHGSRFIQTKLESANKDAKDHVFGEMADNIVPLTKDVFGNYVIQKFLEHGSQKQKEYIAEKMKGRMVDLSTQSYSCRVVQRVMQNSLMEQKLALAKELDGHVVRVVKDNSGNHVVQKIMEEIDRSELDFLVDAIRSKVIELSSHNYGCRIVQKLHDMGSDADRAMIVAEVKDHIQELSMGQFGNYVIQKIIEGNNAEHRSIVIKGVIQKLVPMCKQKFASNVVEACIKSGSQEERHRIREELNKEDSHGVSALHHLANDMFGNYVLQNLLRSLEGDDQRQFIEALTAQVELHRKSGSGRPNAAIDRLADAIEEVSKASQHTATEASKLPKQTPKEAPKEASKQTPKEAPKQTPKQAPKDAPKDAPKQTPKQTPKHAPKQAPKESPNESPSQSPTQSPSVASIPTPPLTNTPNTPESSKPPSFRSGQAEGTVDAKSGETLAAGPALDPRSDDPPGE